MTEAESERCAAVEHEVTRRLPQLVPKQPLSAWKDVELRPQVSHSGDLAKTILLGF
jgi:hypothetical protein